MLLSHLFIPDLQVSRVSSNEGQVMLKCNHSCVPTDNPTYSWYNTRVSYEESQYLEATVSSAESGHSYSCSFKDHDYLRSAAVCEYETYGIKLH